VSSSFSVMTPLISCLLPVYDGETTIISAIQSIQGQTFSDWELIIIDDGSQDKSYELCEGEALKDSRIRVYKNDQNIGLAKTMNRLVSLAAGEYIAVQEQDDRSVPERLEKEVALLESKPDVGIVSGIAAWVDSNDQVINLFPGLLTRMEQFPQEKDSLIKWLYVEQSKIVNAACMFRRELVEGDNLPFDPEAKMSIDWQFFLNLAHQTKAWGIPEVLVRMLRDTDHAHLTSNKQLQFSEARRCIRKIYREYKDNKRSPINRTLYLKSMSHELVLEGRYYGGFSGLGLLLKAILNNPLNKKAWSSIAQMTARGFQQIFRR